MAAGMLSPSEVAMLRHTISDMISEASRRADDDPFMRGVIVGMTRAETALVKAVNDTPPLPSVEDWDAQLAAARIGAGLEPFKAAPGETISTPPHQGE